MTLGSRSNSAGQRNSASALVSGHVEMRGCGGIINHAIFVKVKGAVVHHQQGENTRNINQRDLNASSMHGSIIINQHPLLIMHTHDALSRHERYATNTSSGGRGARVARGQGGRTNAVWGGAARDTARTAVFENGTLHAAPCCIMCTAEIAWSACFKHSGLA